jgi:peptide chain release factor 2
MVTSEQIKALGERLIRLQSYLNLEQKRIHIINEEEKTASPNFWDNPKKAEITMKALRGVKFWVEGYEKASSLFGEAELSLEFFKEGELKESDLTTAFKACENWIEELEFKNMLSGEEDKLSAVLQITAGAGGTESCDWAGMLMRMYIMYAEKQGYTTKELVLQQGDVAGIKTVTIEIEGDFAFGFLKGENG